MRTSIGVILVVPIPAGAGVWWTLNAGMDDPKRKETGELIPR